MATEVPVRHYFLAVKLEQNYKYLIKAFSVKSNQHV